MLNLKEKKRKMQLRCYSIITFLSHFLLSLQFSPLYRYLSHIFHLVLPLVVVCVIMVLSSSFCASVFLFVCLFLPRVYSVWLPVTLLFFSVHVLSLYDRLFYSSVTITLSRLPISYTSCHIPSRSILYTFMLLWILFFILHPLNISLLFNFFPLSFHTVPSYIVHHVNTVCMFAFSWILTSLSSSPPLFSHTLLHGVHTTPSFPLSSLSLSSSSSPSSSHVLFIPSLSTHFSLPSLSPPFPLLPQLMEDTDLDGGGISEEEFKHLLTKCPDFIHSFRFSVWSSRRMTRMRMRSK